MNTWDKVHDLMADTIVAYLSDGVVLKGVGCLGSYALIVKALYQRHKRLSNSIQTRLSKNLTQQQRNSIKIIYTNHYRKNPSSYLL
ncbi:MAG: hypothetical protein NVS9B7_27820 [Flavisolibacter sp.]